MGQGQPGERGDTGPKGDTGNPGVGIQFVTWNSTTGEMIITKTDGSVNPPLKIQGIQGPKGDPGIYEPDQLASAVISRGGQSFISNVGANLANQPQLSTNLATELSKENLYPLFKSKISDNLSANTKFKQDISDNLKGDDGFRAYVSGELGTLVSTDIGKLVSPRTIWCNDNNCSLPITGTLNIPTGYNSSGGDGQPVVFSQKPTGSNQVGGFKHFITTKHDNKDSANNAFDFYVNTDANATTSTVPGGTGNKKVMSVHGKGLDIDGNLNITGGINATGGTGPFVIDPNYNNQSYVQIYDRLNVTGSLDTTNNATIGGELNVKKINFPEGWNLSVDNGYFTLKKNNTVMTQVHTDEKGDNWIALNGRLVLQKGWTMNTNDGHFRLFHNQNEKFVQHTTIDNDFKNSDKMRSAAGLVFHNGWYITNRPGQNEVGIFNQHTNARFFAKDDGLWSLGAKINNLG